jgi:hypothetical protein
MRLPLSKTSNANNSQNQKPRRCSMIWRRKERISLDLTNKPLCTWICYAKRLLKTLFLHVNQSTKERNHRKRLSDGNNLTTRSLKSNLHSLWFQIALISIVSLKFVIVLDSLVWTKKSWDSSKTLLRPKLLQLSKIFRSSNNCNSMSINILLRKFSKWWTMNLEQNGLSIYRVFTKYLLSSKPKTTNLNSSLIVLRTLLSLFKALRSKIKFKPNLRFQMDSKTLFQR